jgi:hypothetical protein
MADKPGLIYEKMAAILADIAPVAKDRENEFHHFNFRGIEDIYQAASEALGKHGVFMVPEVITGTTEERATKNEGRSITRVLTVKYTFFASDGSNVSCTVQGEGADTSDKASNKAMAAAHKYAITQTFVVPYEKMEDGDADTVEHAAAKPSGRAAATAKPAATKAAPRAQAIANTEASEKKEIDRETTGPCPVAKFGTCKGQPITSLPLADWEWYRKTVVKGINDPSKAKFRRSNEQHLAEIDAAMRAANGVCSDEPDSPFDDPDPGGYDNAPDYEEVF